MLYIDNVDIPKKYLGSMFAIDDALGIQCDVNRRLALAHAVFGQLRHVWKSKSISTLTGVMSAASQLFEPQAVCPALMAPVGLQFLLVFSRRLLLLTSSGLSPRRGGNR